MKKEDLLKSAAKLQQPSEIAIAEFESKANSMITIINDELSQRKDIAQLIVNNNLDMMYDNHHNHIRFMTSLFKDYNPEVFTETVLWVFRAYRSHGFNLTYWPAQLDNWVAIYKNQLSEESYNQIYPFYNWMIVNNPLFAMFSDETIRGDAKPQIGKHE